MRLPHPMNANLQNDLDLDLLVDGELPEDRRRQLLISIQEQTSQVSWRDLALRFLQHQTEQLTVRGLMAGGAVLPAAAVTAADRGVISRITRHRYMPLAASVLIAATSALITLFVTQNMGASPTVAEYQTRLPAEIFGSDVSVPVTVPVVHSESPASLLRWQTPMQPNSHESGLLEPDGKGGVMFIRVNSSGSIVY